MSDSVEGRRSTPKGNKRALKCSEFSLFPVLEARFPDLSRPTSCSSGIIVAMVLDKMCGTTVHQPDEHSKSPNMEQGTPFGPKNSPRLLNRRCRASSRWPTLALLAHKGGSRIFTDGRFLTTRTISTSINGCEYLNFDELSRRRSQAEDDAVRLLHG